MMSEKILFWLRVFVPTLIAVCGCLVYFFNYDKEGMKNSIFFCAGNNLYIRRSMVSCR